MKIKLPDGFQMPEGAKPGEPFEVTATLVSHDGGSAELMALDGVKLPDNHGKEEEGEGPEEYADPQIKIPFEKPPGGAMPPM